MVEWVEDFVCRLAKIKLNNVFNPYSDCCDIHDLPNAAEIRRDNLSHVLRQCAYRGVDSIWFGRDLGYRGGRRTGLALTDEVTMLNGILDRSFDNIPKKATNGSVVGERTATVIWSVISRLEKWPVLWNAFPLHPHELGKPLSNRAHSVQERKATAWAINELIDRFGGPRLIAIGNDASKALTSLGFVHDVARHPSYGGQREFVATMEVLHNLNSEQPSDRQPKLI